VLANLALPQQQGFPAAGSSVSGSRSRISLAVSLAVAMSPQLLVRHYWTWGPVSVAVVSEIYIPDDGVSCTCLVALFVLHFRIPPCAELHQNSSPP
jgi:hypothetical protein